MFIAGLLTDAAVTFGTERITVAIINKHPKPFFMFIFHHLFRCNVKGKKYKAYAADLQLLI